ncbi:CdiI family contact-dependent growth inhibition immunity protein [Acinetobacter soli]|uniref:contact-dependent growth inhibition system immunity protein n=1 Tax=Acinetobacter soli TaxID=487316 RepID=UPI000E6AB6C8|nr:contact-dependent growth inhibition system immunity protein [Acinetobacter soli]MBU3121744.1 CdiI family contact-dependent growth inhibition immunity protein [Acinetobacter soli]
MKRATVYFNNKYIEVISWNYGGMSVFNINFIPLIFEIEIDNHILGEAIRKALSAGSNIPPEGIKEFLFSSELADFMKERNKKIMENFGYKSKKALFKNMRSVDIELDSKVNISPSHQDGLDYSFTGLSKDDEIILPNDATNEELGKAVRLAYEKCTSIY